MYRSVQRVRYPPFDHENSDPRGIPLVEVILESEGYYHFGNCDHFMVWGYN